MAEWQPAKGRFLYYTNDPVRSVRLVTDPAGKVVWSAAYAPFGRMEKVWARDYNPSLKYSGKERDELLGLDYFGARYYAFGLYRFNSTDPVVDMGAAIENPQSWNRYAYCRNNPTTLFDPHGDYVIYRSTDIENMSNQIAAESPSYASEIAAARGDQHIWVYVEDLGVRKLGDHAPGDASTRITPAGNIIFHIRVAKGDERTLEHEWGHEKDARTNTSQFFQDSKQTNIKQGGPFEVPHNERPEEKRADQFKNQVEQERKQYQLLHPH